MPDPPLSTPARSPVPAVGVVCLRGDEVLLIRRGRAPLQGAWSLPGGRIEWGERVSEAALRELAEETGVRAEILGLIEVVDGVVPAAPSEGAKEEVEHHYVLVDLAARWVGGEPRAGDDASDAAFHRVDALSGLGLWSETLRIIELARARYGG
jgi:8-oxo-dGTP diphosphatase